MVAISYACSGKQSRGSLRYFRLLCLLGHATVAAMVKKPMTPAQKAAQILSQLGASKGGKARAKQLTPARRKAIAQAAANARWQKNSEN